MRSRRSWRRTRSTGTTRSARRDGGEEGAGGPRDGARAAAGGEEGAGGPRDGASGELADGAGSDATCAPALACGEGDYVNCPLDRAQYDAFIAAVNAGRKVLPHDFEEPRYFESCMPIEVMAERGPQTLRFGPMRPIGLRDPRTGHRPWAVVQLRPENRYLTAYNMVGFQTRLAYPEQQRIFAMIPALHRAEFLRFGSIHRNTYIDAPSRLGPRFELRTRPSVRFAGLLTGVEGYIESCAMGLVVAWMLAGELTGRAAPPPPPTTMMGGLYQHVTAPRPERYKYGPTNVNYGLLPPPEEGTRPHERGSGGAAGAGTRKDHRKARMAERARRDLDAWLGGVAVRAA